jgi:hypothetical protein
LAQARSDLLADRAAMNAVYLNGRRHKVFQLVSLWFGLEILGCRANAAPPNRFRSAASDRQCQGKFQPRTPT